MAPAPTSTAGRCLLGPARISRTNPPLANDDALIAAYLNGDNESTAVVAATVPAGTSVVHDLNLVAGEHCRPGHNLRHRRPENAAGVNLHGAPNTARPNFSVYVSSGGVHFLADLPTP